MRIKSHRFVTKKAALEALANQIRRDLVGDALDLPHLGIMWTRRVKRTGNRVDLELYAEDEDFERNEKLVDQRKIRITIEEL